MAILILALAVAFAFGYHVLWYPRHANALSYAFINAVNIEIATNEGYDGYGEAGRKGPYSSSDGICDVVGSGCTYFHVLRIEDDELGSPVGDYFAEKARKCPSWWLFRSNCVYLFTTARAFELPSVRRALSAVTKEPCAPSRLPGYAKVNFTRFVLADALGCSNWGRSAFHVTVVTLPEHPLTIMQRMRRSPWPVQREAMLANAASAQVHILE